MTEGIPLVLKQKDWPEADRLAWYKLVSDGDIFDAAGPCSHWKPGTRKKRLQGYGQWLSFLMRTDRADLALPPAKRITRARVSAYIDECEMRLKPRSVEGLIGDLLYTVKNISPNEDWNWLRSAFNRLVLRSNGQTLPPPAPITASEIFGWSLARMSEVSDDNSLSDFRRAIRFRQALMIGLLISRPVRRRAFMSITVSEHLKRAGDGYLLCFKAEDMKDARAREFTLSSQLVEPLEIYLAHFRLRLLGIQQSEHLWINQYGKPITKDGYSRELPKLMQLHLGVSLRPHGFRHVAATSIAEADPKHVDIIRDIRKIL